MNEAAKPDLPKQEAALGAGDGLGEDLPVSGEEDGDALSLVSFDLPSHFETSTFKPQAFARSMTSS